MIDCVYVLGSGSTWADNELRFSLRSLFVNMPDLGNVYVVGRCPAWLTNVVHLEWPDNYKCKERNIMEKLAYACGHPDLSETFLHVHDDHFMLKPGNGADVPFWHSCELEKIGNSVRKKQPSNNWGLAVLNTHAALKEAGHTTKNFDVHFPMLFNKNLYPEIMDRYNWRGEMRGYVVKSLYANTLGIEGVKTSDIKLNGKIDLRQVVDKLSGRDWFSIGNGVLSADFKRFMHALYPTPSKFEIVS